MSKVRKHLYLDAKQEQKLREYAARWGCSEAGVMRVALDRLTDLDHSVVSGTWDRTSQLDDEAGEEPLSDQALAALEAESEAWFREHPQPLGLSEAVFLDREGR
ncbi:MAG: hypothetical protein AB7R89_02910 [Dehalococcoidia bacterium]